MPTQSARRVERRGYERMPARFSVKLRATGRSRGTHAGAMHVRATHGIEGTSVDISETGMLVELPRDISSTSPLLVEFRVPPGVFHDRFVHRLRIRARVVRSWSDETTKCCLAALQFETDFKKVLARTTWRRLAWLSVAVFVFALCNTFILKARNVEYFWHQPLVNTYGLLVTGYILSRFVISSLYRAPRDVGYTPKVSVIVACKNEEEHIAAVLERAFDSHYPRELLEVIAIDDGSTDKTLEEMTRVRRKHSDLKLIRFRKNRGKRHGMAAGARAATGDVLVYVDSDSYLERDAIYRIVQGLADPRVAAVAGHAYAANAWTNLLTRTQAVQYYVAFNVLKAAESVFSCVTCCSGCFAAYRRDRVIEVLDVWLNQTFLGRPATFGDDRSLTNFMLRDYKIIYDSRASVSTVVPEKFSQFFRQQLRWKKSWLRENSIAATFLWKKTPIVMLSFFAGFILPLIGPLVVFRALVYLPVVAGHMNYLYVWGVFLMSLLYSAYYLLREKNRMWVCGVFLCFLYALLLTWQLPWAIVTSWNNKWGTR